MFFGLANAPATFQTYIHRALNDLVDTICVVYLDDILIYSKDPENHTQHVRMVLARLREFGLYANLDKCTFHTEEISFLGFVISPRGFEMEGSRVVAIKEWPVPRSRRDIQIFLGFTGFYRRFIKNYSKVATPLTDLLRGKEPMKFELDNIGLAIFYKLRFMF